MKLYKFDIIRNEEGLESSGAGALEESPSYIPFINEDYSFSEGWQDKFGDDAKGLTFKTMPDLLKSYKSSVSKITELGQKVKELGGGEGTAIPTDVSGYLSSIQIPTELPEGVYIPDGLLDEAAKYGIANNIPPSLTQKFIEFQLAQAGKEVDSYKNQQFVAGEQAKAQIAQIVGKENYEVTISNAKAAHDLLGLKLNESDLINNPSLVISLSKIHTKISPAELRDLNLTSEGQSAQGKLQQAEDIVGNKNNPDHEAFYDKTHMNHDNVMAKYNRLISESMAR